jgi:Flp pilus assembly protein TadD
MPEPKYHQLAVVQLSFNPAYLDDSGVSFLHEPIFPGDDQRGLHKLAGLPEVRDLRARIATNLIDHMSHKVKTVIEHAATQNVELLVLPEYSIPHELLEECRNLSCKFGMAIIAGSHIATRPALAEHTRLGMSKLMDEKRLGRAVCPVFLPNGDCHFFEKAHRSKWESSLIPGAPNGPITISLGGENFPLEVMICIDAVQESGSQKARRGRLAPSLTAMPSLTPDASLFYNRAQLLLGSGRVTLFANIAEFGGSRVFARAERTKGWMVATDGTEPIPRYAEALVVIEADLSNQFDIRKSTQEHFPVRAASIIPLIYAAHSDACKEFVTLVRTLPGQLGSETDLQENVKRFATMDYRLFPRMMQDKLKHFLANVAAPGLADKSAWERWLTPVIVETTPSTDVIRWDLSGKAIDTINELNLSGRYPEMTDIFTATYGYLASKRNELRSRIDPGSATSPAPASPLSDEPQPVTQSLGSFEPRFFDREPMLSTLQNFISSDKSCFVLAGMRGIGKTAVTREAFKKVIPPTWKRVLVTFTEGASYPRLLAEFAHQSGLRFPVESSLDSSAKQIDLAQNLLLYFSHTPRFVVVLDDCQFLLEPNGDFSDENTGRFLAQLIQVAGTRKNKLILVTTQIPKLDERIRDFVELKHLKGLERKDSENLFSYWFRFEREDLGAHPISYPEKLLNVLNGHPLGVKVAAKLVAERTTQQVESEAAIFKRLRETIISFFLEHVQLSAPEDELIRFASVFRLPVRRDAFVAWKADQAGFLLESLLGRSLLEAEGEEHSLHPIIRDYFYTTTDLSVLRPFHKAAGAYFLERYKKGKTATAEASPEMLGEAIHHYLCAGERDKVNSFALYRYELRPVALMHYRRREFNLALKDYRVLITLDPNDSDAHFHLALIYAKNRTWDRAEEHFGKAMKLKPNAYWILQGYAHAKLVDGQVDEAEQLLQQAVDINPRHSPSLTDLGTAYARQGDEVAAESYFKQAIEADPNNAFAYSAYARFLLRIERCTEGLEMARAALEINPRDERNRQLIEDLRMRLESASKISSD